MTSRSRRRSLWSCIAATLLCGAPVSGQGPSSGEAPPATVLDERTGLTWTRTDNAFALDGDRAAAWCRGLRLDGASDWRLPSMDELAGIYDTATPAGRRKIWSKLELSPEAVALWSATLGACCGQAASRLALDFTDGSTRGGGQLPGAAEGTDLRALCVRGRRGHR